MGTRRFTTTVVGFGALAASVIGASVIGQGTASAGSPSDDRALFIEGNVAPGVCPQGTSEVPKSALDFDETTTSVTINGVDAGYTVTDIYVKGGDDTNLYEPGARSLPASPPWTDLISPFNNGGQIPAISHWFACGTTTAPTTSTTTTIPATTTTTTIPATTTTTTMPATTTTTTIPATTTTQATTTTSVLPTTSMAATTTTAAESTTTAANESTTAPPTTGASTTTIVPPPNTGTLPNTGSSGSSNVIAIAVLALLGGVLALVIARRRAL